MPLEVDLMLCRVGSPRVLGIWIMVMGLQDVKVKLSTVYRMTHPWPTRLCLVGSGKYWKGPERYLLTYGSTTEDPVAQV